MTIREQLEQRERDTLSPYASLSSASRGRVRTIEPCPYRTDFQRDRDRIIHCNSFQRLKHKTQVFLAPQGDHYRTRLTHTLEVSQIARTIARALSLNEDLTEAIALGHDIGHTPFGHAGERALTEAIGRPFHHNYQSVRVVDHIENYGRGMNLTYEVKNGIACHSTSPTHATTLEGRIVRIADKIAYINHDIVDAVRAGVLEEPDLPYDCVYVLGRSKSDRISTVVQSIVEQSTGRNEIVMAPQIQRAHDSLRAFMFGAVYTNPVAKSEEGKAERIVMSLYKYYKDNVNLLPEFYDNIIERFGEEEAVCGYVAGMTDNFAVETYKSLVIPRSWMM